jgi:hypothetical protein
METAMHHQSAIKLPASKRQGIPYLYLLTDRLDIDCDIDDLAFAVLFSHDHLLRLIADSTKP